jgi:hypothetical protein
MADADHPGPGGAKVEHRLDKLMHKVNTARMTGTVAALNELIDDLHEFQSSVFCSLMTIKQANLTMQAGTEIVIHALKAA